MCTDQQLVKHIDNMTMVLAGHVSSMADSLRVGTDEKWETSEPYAVGGPAGAYQLQSPFIGDCQFKIDFASAGAAASTALVSTSPRQAAPGIASTDQPVSGLSAINGLVVSVPANQTVPVDSEWYNVRDSQNNIFIITTSPLYINIQFRHKR